MLEPTILIAIALSVFSAVVCYFAKPIGEWLGVIDHPATEPHKVHSRPTPLVGGLAIMLPTVLILGLAIWSLEPSRSFEGIALAVMTLFLVGYVDDRFNVSARLRFLLSIFALMAVLAAAPAFVMEELKFSFMATPIRLGSWAFPFTVVCLLGFQNAVNMADGRNGIAIGMTVIWAIALYLYSADANAPIIVTLGASAAIALAFNLRSRLFLGDSGTYAIAIALGFLFIQAHRIAPYSVPADLICIWLAVPVADCLRLIGARLLQRRSPFSGGRDHLHHVLEDRFPYPLAIYLTMVGTPILLAYLFPELLILWFALAILFYTGAVARFEVKRFQLSKLR